LAADEHVIRLRDTLLPLAERFHRMGAEAVEGLRRQRQMPSVEVERAVPREIRLIPAERDNRPAIEGTTDALDDKLFGLGDCEPVCGRSTR
jgi:hypothetical protein